MNLFEFASSIKPESEPDIGKLTAVKSDKIDACPRP
jgi:hypothetical protein